MLPNITLLESADISVSILLLLLVKVEMILIIYIDLVSVVMLFPTYGPSFPHMINLRGREMFYGVRTNKVLLHKFVFAF